ncbi:unnamed protein product [Linum tenue]|uniref:Ribulose bisphosphate carboxylase small subunit n=1 Tax=Linum tenue TaxID=586396 RepID=A0AAV0MYV4_9ROSI|nr:unnamed protein product [Linum tenue]CAI0451346.1 unnamed protein product [Linum tenue]
MASMISSSAVATVSRTGAQASMVAPFTGLKSTAAFPATRKSVNDITSITSNGGRVQCMKVWPPLGLKKYETLSYLPPLTEEQLGKEVDYLLRSGWVPCLEFELEVRSPVFQIRVVLCYNVRTETWVSIYAARFRVP